MKGYLLSGRQSHDWKYADIKVGSPRYTGPNLSEKIADGLRVKTNEPSFIWIFSSLGTIYISYWLMGKMYLKHLQNQIKTL